MGITGSHMAPTVGAIFSEIYLAAIKQTKPTDVKREKLLLAYA